MMLMHEVMMIMFMEWNVSACLTPRCYIPYGNLLHGCIVHVSRTCLWISLLLVALILICTLLIWAFPSPMASLVAIKAWQIAFWPCGASLAYFTLGYDNSEGSTKHLLRTTSLGFLLGRPEFRCWG